MLRNCNASNIFYKCTRAACGRKSRSSQKFKRSYCIEDMHNEVFPLLIRSSQSSGQFNPHYQELAALLKSCAALLAINSGKALHGYVVKHGDLSCLSVSKALLNMYAKCGALDDCKTLFGQMCSSDPVIWNIILSGFSASRNYNGEVMKVFHEMHVVGKAKPTSVTIAIVLPVCARIGDLDMGKSVHSYVMKSGLETDLLVGNALISMYAKSGLVSDDACTVFENIADKDVVSWNAIIGGCSENRLIKKAYELIRWMLKEPVDLNYVTIATILPICASLDNNAYAYWSGREIHCYVLRRRELAADVSVCNALISFYLLVGEIEKAESLFQRMKSRDLVSWNAIIAGYASNGEWLKALNLFHKLLSLQTVGPDSVTILSILPSCAHLKLLHVGREIHGYVLRHPMLYESTAVGNAIVSFYVKCDKIEDALETFLMMSKRDVISWNTMLVAFSGIGYSTKFLNFLNGLLKEGMIPDHITILTIIQFCSGVCRVEKVKETHSYAIKAGFLLDNIGNAILDAYAKCGNMEYAFKMFQSLSQKFFLVTGNSMISAYVNAGSHDDAQMILNSMSETDLISWNLMVQAYAENGCPAEAINLFNELQAQGMKPDAMTIMSLLPLSVQMSSVHLLKQCHGYVVRAFLPDVYLTGAVLDMYAKCGAILCAYKLFQSSLHKDLVMFTAMIGGFAMHGMGEEALRIFSHMLKLGIKPDNVVITAVLSACSHAGFVNEGLKIFHTIKEVYGVKPTMEQYACVVDLLGRGGRIDDAFSFVSKMPIAANANIWGTLLGACRTHHMVDLGRVVAGHLFDIEADNIGNYVVMSNLYASEARWDRVQEVRQLMRIRDLKKPAGCSWIEVERRTNRFIAGDLSHPLRSTIYSTLSMLDQQIKEPV